MRQLIPRFALVGLLLASLVAGSPAAAVARNIGAAACPTNLIEIKLALAGDLTHTSKQVTMEGVVLEPVEVLDYSTKPIRNYVWGISHVDEPEESMLLCGVKPPGRPVAPIVLFGIGCVLLGIGIVYLWIKWDAARAKRKRRRSRNRYEA